jgi:hypothetical protein
MAQKEKMMDIMFEELNVQGTYVAPSGLLSSVNCAIKDTGLVVEIGDGVTQGKRRSLPIYNLNLIIEYSRACHRWQGAIAFGSYREHWRIRHYDTLHQSTQQTRTWI